MKYSILKFFFIEKKENKKNKKETILDRQFTF